jgi:hypothetical protein
LKLGPQHESGFGRCQIKHRGVDFCANERLLLTVAANQAAGAQLSSKQKRVAEELIRACGMATI